MATVISQEPPVFALCRSPLIVTLYDTNFALDGFKYVLDVFIWHGAEASVPGTRSYRLSKPPNPDNRGVFDIKDFVATEIEQFNSINDITGIVSAGETAVNVLVKGGYEADTGDDLANVTGTRFTSAYGYTLFKEGVNANKTVLATEPQYLLTDRPLTIYLYSDRVATLPIFIPDDNPNRITDIIFRDDQGNDDAVDVDLIITDSADRIKYIPINPDLVDVSVITSRKYFIDLVNLESVTTFKTYTVIPVCEPKYERYQVWFVNRYGVWDFIICPKKSTASVRTMGKDYMKNTSYLESNQLTYNTEHPNIQDYNKDGENRLTLNTGFQDEGLGVLIEQMMLSERILIEFPNGDFLPYRLTDLSMDIAKAVNERNINYSLSFESAFNSINSIR